jgi:hypothetical protein
MANGWNPLIGIGFTALGIGYLWESSQKRHGNTPLGTGDSSGLGALAPYAAKMPPVRRSRSNTRPTHLGALQPMSATPNGLKSMKFYPAGDIKNRVGRIADQIRKDSLDPNVVSAARAIVSQKCGDIEGGRYWCVPVKDWKGEIKAVFNAVTNPNSPFAVRYTRDHVEVDMFASSELMARLPAEDCDGLTIRVGALLRALGYHVRCRVVAPAGSPEQWSHIYLAVAVPPGSKDGWMPLDPSEAQHGAFWEVPQSYISSKRDFEV